MQGFQRFGCLGGERAKAFRQECSTSFSVEAFSPQAGGQLSPVFFGELLAATWWRLTPGFPQAHAVAFLPSL